MLIGIWDPDALKEYFCHGNIFASNIGSRCWFSSGITQAGLRHFPHELGLLLQKDANNSTAIRAACWLWLVNWKLIVQCFEEMGNDKIFEKDPTTNLYPFMLAAADDSTPRLDLVYYLLRKDPEVLAPL